MSDFGGPDPLAGFERDRRTSDNAIAVLQGQVAALTAYIAHAGLVVKDGDILAIKGEAQEATRYLPAPFGITPAPRHASEYVDRIHLLATQNRAGNEGSGG
jgi:hypothetical protein